VIHLDYDVEENVTGDISVTDAWLTPTPTLQYDPNQNGYYSKIKLNWITTISSGTQNVYAKVFKDNQIFGEERLATSDVYSVTGAATQSLIIHIANDSVVSKGTYDLRVRVYDAATHQELASRTEWNDADLDNVPLEPGGDGTQLPAGKWTTIIHGLSTDAYSTMVNTGGWMMDMAKKLWTESRNVAVHTISTDTNAWAGSLGSLVSLGQTNLNTETGQWTKNDVTISDTGYHHVLLFDWAEVSNYTKSGILDIWPGIELPPIGASGNDGYAEASADVLYALLSHLPGDEHALIGYSRGAVVASETSQRLVRSERSIDHVIYLDAEGGGESASHSAPTIWLYDDDEFWAWSGIRTDNYYSSAPDYIAVNLGGHHVAGARNFDDGLEYMHHNFHHYFTGDLSNGANDGLFAVAQRIVTKDTPATATGATKDPTYDAPAMMGLFNGSFEYTDSTAGWWYHGSSTTDVSNYGTVENGRLWLNGGQHRTHNWSYAPANAKSLEFDFQATTPSFTAELVVSWSGPNGQFAELGRVSLSSGSMQLNRRMKVPIGMASQIGRVTFKVVGSGSARVWIDNISWSDQPPPSTAPWSSEAAPLSWGGKVDQAFREKVLAIAENVETKADFLMAVMAFETGETFSAAVENPQSGAVGLIQFTQVAINDLNQYYGIELTKDILRNMPALEQLEYVEKWFSMWQTRKQLDTYYLEDLYMAVFAPAGIGKAPGYVLYESPAVEYTQNAGLDADGDGKITVREAALRIRNMLQRGLEPGNVFPGSTVVNDASNTYAEHLTGNEDLYSLYLPSNIGGTATITLEFAASDWIWPTVTNDPGPYLGWLGWNDDFNGYHLAHDFIGTVGAPVYAVADGIILESRTDVAGYGPDGTPGGAFIALFQNASGEYFKALYGHIDNPLPTGTTFGRGDVLGVVNAYDPAHLHFGIHPGTEWGFEQNPWQGYTPSLSDTLGWVSPIEYLNNNAPFSLELTLVDTHGNAVAGVTEHRGGGTIALDVSGLAAGPYFVVVSGPAWAEGTAYSLTFDIAQSGIGGASVVSVIDVSGSMAGSPLADAKTAANAFIDLMNPGDRIGIVSFSSSAQTEFPLTLISQPGPTTTFFSDSLDSLANWTASAPWSLTTATYVSGPSSVTDSPAANYENSADTAIWLTQPVYLPVDETAALAFWTKYELESSYDYGRVEVSSDEGATWTELHRLNGYRDDWHEVVVPLSGYAGTGVQVRFRLTSDSSVTKDGWYIDDVAIRTGAGTKNTAKAAVDSLSANGGTSIGAGIREANQQLAQFPDDPRRVIIVMTDGDENTAPWAEDVIRNEVPDDVVVYMIGFGGYVDMGFLREIAEMRGGQAFAAPTGSQLRDIYLDIVGAAGIQTPLLRWEGMIQPAERLSQLIYTDTSAQSASFVLTWEGSDLDLVLIDPIGNVVSRQSSDGVAFEGGATSEFYRIDRPMPGQWTVEVVGVDVPQQDYPFTMRAFVDSPINSTVISGPGSYAPAAPVSIAVRLDEEIPITMASVEATIAPPVGSDAGPFRVFLRDDGRDADAVAGDGVYSAVFNSTDWDGTYDVTLDVFGMSNLGNAFAREITTSFNIVSTRIIRLTGDLAFGDVAVGDTEHRTVTIHNDGNTPLTVSSVSFPTGFTGEWSGTITEGAWQDVTVAFAPTARQSYSGTIIVNSDSTDGSNTQACSGTGTIVVDPDGFEPNDTWQTATNLGTIVAERSESGLSIHSDADADWFCFALAARGDANSAVKVLFTHADGDIDAFLYSDPNQARIASGQSASNNETLSLSGLAPGTYYVQVYGFAGATNTYSLAIVPPAHPTYDLMGRITSNGDWWLGASNGTDAFTNSKVNRWNPNLAWADIMVGDFTGNRLDDIVGRIVSTGDWWVAVNNGDGTFTNQRWGRWNPNVTFSDIMVGDFTGDEVADIVGRVATTGDWWVAKSTGTGFTNQKWGRWNPNVEFTSIMAADFTGDGKADIAGRIATTGDWWVARSTGSSFTNQKWGRWNPNIEFTSIMAADFTGDVKADIAGRIATTGDWWVAKSTGTGFANAKWTRWNPSLELVDVMTADFTGDGKADIAGRVVTSGDWWVAESTGTGFANAKWTRWNPSLELVDVMAADFTGDGVADIAGRVVTSGDWWVAESTGTGFANAKWTRWNPTLAWGQVLVGNFAPAPAALHAAYAPTPSSQLSPDSQLPTPISQSALQPIVEEAVLRMSADLETVAFQVHIVDLPGLMLGRTVGNTILIDHNAAGFGWYLSPTDADFQPGGRLGELTAQSGTEAVHRIDLLTVVMHELGHLLGYEHAESGLMQPAISPGTRWLPESEEALLSDQSLEADRLDAYFATLG
jgi:Mg-chelatase subunit ChlD